MRPFSLLLLALTFGNTLAMGQNAAQMAAQQATQTAQQAAQISSQNTQMASQQAMRDAQLANQNAQIAQQQAGRNARSVLVPPTFSMKTGAYSSSIRVEIKEATPGAAIYYTTDTWTPTAKSLPYAGPISIDETTTLQAIAILANGTQSRVTTSLYTLPTKPNVPTSTSLDSVAIPFSSSENLLLAEGTAVPLAFASDVSSKNLNVGDRIDLTLAEDLKAGNVVVAKKGTPAFAHVTGIDKAHFMGIPAELYFQVDSLQAGATLVKLKGSAAKQGVDRATAALMIPPPGGVLVHGKDAQIKQGAIFTAHVNADTPLPPVN